MRQPGADADTTGLTAGTWGAPVGSGTWVPAAQQPGLRVGVIDNFGVRASADLAETAAGAKDRCELFAEGACLSCERDIKGSLKRSVLFGVFCCGDEGPELFLRPFATRAVKGGAQILGDT